MTKKAVPKKSFNIPSVCGNCRHWRKHPDTDPKDPSGDCKRYPPTVVSMEEHGLAATNPATNSTDFCGEFAIRQDA